MHLRSFVIALVALLAGSGLFATDSYMSIIVASGTSKMETNVYVYKLKKRFGDKAFFKKAEASEGMKVVNRLSGKRYVVSLEPVRDSKTAFALLEKMQALFPDAYIFTHRGDEPPKAEAPKVEVKTVYVKSKPEIKTVYVPAKPEVKTVYVDKPSSHALSGTILVVLAALAVIVLILLWLMLRQRKKLSSVSKELKEEHDTLEQIIGRQEDMMLNVGEKIRRPAKEINQSSEKILQTRLDPIQSQELQKIKYSDELLLDITNDLIDFMNLKSNKVTLKHELFNINNVLDEVAGMVSSRSRGHNVEFIFDIEKEVPAKFIGDSLRLGQILTNLLSNAMKFTKDGEVRLHIRRLPNNAKKVNLEFTISDTGMGIDQQRFNDIFEPFSSANDLRETGLGLFISRALIDMMGGTIEMKSQVQKGTDFILTIPFDVQDINEKRHYRLPAKAYTGHKFVIIEVQPTAADALKKMLEYFKHNVSVRSLTAIGNKSDILFQSEVIVIAEDAFTPDIQALIKRVKAETDTKIVLAGSMINEPHDVSSFKALIDARIMKPLNLQRVYDLIVDLFEEDIKEVDTVGITPQHTKPSSFMTNKTYEDIPETPNITKKSFADFAGASVLIVEDNLINQKVLLSLFNGSGIKVKVAGDGVEALEAINDPANRFDLVLMDINMPVMDGYEATKHIRANSEFDAMPVVSLTGLGLPEEIAKMYAIGMDAHLTKPVQVGRLYTAFKRFVKPKPKAAEPQKQPARKKQMTSAVKNTDFVNTEVLEARDGLARASGDADLYGEILEEFIKLYAGADDALNMLLRTYDFDNARKLVHDIKGVSANIGAVHLSQASDALSRALLGREEEKLPVLREEFIRHLHAVLKEARKYVS
jgi:two-component system, sensor histidine kinase and response regulator